MNSRFRVAQAARIRNPCDRFQGGRATRENCATGCLRGGLRASSSGGESSGLLIRRSGVRVPPGAPEDYSRSQAVAAGFPGWRPEPARGIAQTGSGASQHCQGLWVPRCPPSRSNYRGISHKTAAFAVAGREGGHVSKARRQQCQDTANGFPPADSTIDKSGNQVFPHLCGDREGISGIDRIDP